MQNLPIPQIRHPKIINKLLCGIGKGRVGRGLIGPKVVGRLGIGSPEKVRVQWIGRGISGSNQKDQIF